MKTRTLALIALTTLALCGHAQTPTTNLFSFTLPDDSVITAPKVMRIADGLVTLKHTRGISTLALAELDEKTRAALNLPAPPPPPAPQLAPQLIPLTPATSSVPTRAACPTCNARGATTCATCNGSKYTQTKRLDPCATCGGDGYIGYHYFRGNYVPSRRCTLCDGKGKTDKGSYDTLYCTPCGGHGNILCRTCNGTKTIQR